jgi:hypothetical protein
MPAAHTLQYTLSVAPYLEAHRTQIRVRGTGTTNMLIAPSPRRMAKTRSVPRFQLPPYSLRFE